MNRIIPTAVVGFIIFGLMYRGFETASATANNASPNSTALPTVDTVLQSSAEAGGVTFPIAMLIAAVAVVLGVGLLVGGGR